MYKFFQKKEKKLIILEQKRNPIKYMDFKN